MSDATRRKWRIARDQISREAIGHKDSAGAIEALELAYAGLNATERMAVDEELAAWLASEDEGLRFDALALIRANQIDATAPALVALARRLSESTAPSAPYERAKVERVLRALTSD